jgi:hypothetical protein
MTFKATVQEIRVARGFKGCRVLPGAIAEIACQSAVSRRVTQIFNQIRRIARTSIQNESLTIARSCRPLGGWVCGLPWDLTAIDRFRSLRRGAELLWGPSAW